MHNVDVEAFFQQQMTAIGTTAMEQVSRLHVLLIGLRGVGVEIAKCIAQSGIHRLTLLDDELVRDEDLYVNYLVQDGDQGKVKSQVVASRLMEKNPFTDIRVLTRTLTVDLLLNFHIVVFSSTNTSREELIAYNEFCRAQSPPIGFLLTESRGLVASIFTDYGARHCSMQTQGESDAQFRLYTKKTSCSTPEGGNCVRATVFPKEPTAFKSIQPGEWVALHHHLDTPSPSTPCALWEVLLVDSKSIQLVFRSTSSTSSASAIDSLNRATRIQRIEQPHSTYYRSLRESLMQPQRIVLPLHADKNENSTPFHGHSAHMAMMGLYSFRQEYGFVPKSNDVEHCSQTLQLIHTLLQQNAKVSTHSQNGQMPMITAKDIDIRLVREYLRCMTVEFLPLSSLVAGYTALQVLKFTGALGRPLFDGHSYMYFDLLDLAPSWDTFAPLDVPRRSSNLAMSSLFGSNCQQIQAGTPLLIGMDAINNEVLKHILSFGIETIQVILPPSHDDIVRAESVNACTLLSATHVGDSIASKLEAIGTLRKIQIHVQDETKCEDRKPYEWLIPTATASFVMSDTVNIISRIGIDEACRMYEKPCAYTDINGVRHAGSPHVTVTVPHRTATYSEQFLPPSITNKTSQIHAFAHVPSSSGSNHEMLAKKEMGTERDEVVYASCQCFELIFNTAIEQAHSYFLAKEESQISNLWLVWSVIQRGQDSTQSFADCVCVAWILLEIIPIVLDTIEERRDDDNSLTTAILIVDINDTDHLQLLVSTACIVAMSLGISVPPLDDRRSVVTSVSISSPSFSLHCHPQSIESITQCLSSNLNNMIRVLDRVRRTTLDITSTGPSWSLQFVQSLANIQLNWRHAPRVKDLPHVRHLLRSRAATVPMTTVLASLAVIEMCKARISNATLYEYTIAPSGSDLNVISIPQPLTAQSIPLEVTRSVPLRVIPDQGYTCWSTLVIPTSRDLQTARAIINYVERKFNVVIHALLHRGQRLAIEKETRAQISIVDQYGGPKVSFIVLDVIAVDGAGDVVMPPLRVNRSY